MTLLINNNTISTTSTGVFSWVDSHSLTDAGSQMLIRAKAGDIHPKLYFKFLKSKLRHSDLADLKKRLNKLKILADKAWASGQSGLAEQFEESLVLILREQEIAAAGCGKFVITEDINRFLHIVRARTIKQCDLKNFPRLIPAKVQKKLDAVRRLKIFDEYVVLYNDPLNTALVKTNKEKVVEKDPILFGKVSFDPTRYFFIIDWVDEHCDLTMDKFIEEFSSKIRNEYALSEIEEPSKESLDAVRLKVEKRHAILKATNSRNWQEQAALAEEVKPAKRSCWWRFLRTFCG
jgi:hypothetical protein